MQSERTVQFWDDFYVAQQQQGQQDNDINNNNKEWILQPTQALLDQLSKHITDSTTRRCCCSSPPTSSNDGDDDNDNDEARRNNVVIIRILEIGSGTSCLARDLCLYLNDQNNKSMQEKKNHHRPPVEFHVWATDVSPVCIEQCRERDAKFLRSSTDNTIIDSFSENTCQRYHQDGDNASFLYYHILNVVDAHHHAAELEGKFDVILDKGCLDTFLFRSRYRGTAQERDYSPLVRTVLDNVHTWLRHDDSHNRKEQGDDNTTLSPSSSSLTSSGGVYLILTPRVKLRSVRDFKGFSSVERHVLDTTQLDLGELEPNNRSDNNDNNIKDRIFLYKCQKNPSYVPLSSNDDAVNAGAFSITTGDNATTACPKCKMSLDDFCKDKTTRSKVVWRRQWNGHIQHCKG